MDNKMWQECGRGKAKAGDTGAARYPNEWRTRSGRIWDDTMGETNIR